MLTNQFTQAMHFGTPMKTVAATIALFAVLVPIKTAQGFVVNRTTKTKRSPVRNEGADSAVISPVPLLDPSRNVEDVLKVSTVRRGLLHARFTQLPTS